ncbi:hypothetical protein [Acidithiobacillus sp.]|uniref:hypothetical protein n=1 Tax=Acidithiobacillus sp. TaxID=1872118 RepID=UPI00260D64B6|nr:hypothetical protein [Acidithiobacillus sp.]MDD2749651.1 hypothetical protein [Acidithiobacillus sp.]MDD5279181.1 hypothetical protein [Acidithiobacillus sp.]
MPVNFVTRGPTERAISFEAQYVDGILHISGLDERHIQHSYSAIEIYLILKSLQQQFGQNYFPLANNVESLTHRVEKPGLGMTILQVGFDNSTQHAQGSSYFGPCLEHLGYCEWNGENQGIQWRLIREKLSDRQLLQDLSERF